MALKVKTADQAGEKFGRKAPGSVPDYIIGIENPKREWQISTLASEEIYETATQEAISDKRFGKGVKRSSDAEHKTASVGKGASRYPEGVRLAVPKYVERMGPVLAHMARITLPPPGPRGSQLNIERSVTFQREMAKFRTG